VEQFQVYFILEMNFRVRGGFCHPDTNTDLAGRGIVTGQVREVKRIPGEVYGSTELFTFIKF